MDALKEALKNKKMGGGFTIKINISPEDLMGEEEKMPEDMPSEMPEVKSIEKAVGAKVEPKEKDGELAPDSKMMPGPTVGKPMNSFDLNAAPVKVQEEKVDYGSGSDGLKKRLQAAMEKKK